jgi:hypothetical protein
MPEKWYLIHVKHVYRHTQRCVHIENRLSPPKKLTTLEKNPTIMNRAAQRRSRESPRLHSSGTTENVEDKEGNPESSPEGSVAEALGSRGRGCQPSLPTCTRRRRSRQKPAAAPDLKTQTQGHEVAASSIYLCKNSASPV